MQKYICKNCNAELFWNPESNSLKCQYCGFEYLPSDFKEEVGDTTKNVDYEVDKKYASSNEANNENMVVYQCTNCGAEVVTSKGTVATKCAYCGKAITLTNKIVGNFRPDCLIPFAIKKDSAVSLYKKYAKSSLLTPSEFKLNSKIEEMQGLYVPYWLHSMDTRANSVVTCEKVSSSKHGYDKVETHTVYDVYVDANGQYHKVPADGSSKLDNKLMDSIEPFNYKKLVGFNPAYMAGFVAEQYDEDKEKTFPRAQKKVENSMKEKAISTAKATGHYTTAIMKSHDETYGNAMSEYAMLPVWMLNVDYKGQKHTFAINGETGKVVGKLPISKMKVFLFGGGSFLITQIVALIIKLLTI